MSQNKNNPNILTRSSYTFFNSILKIDDIVGFSKENGFSSAFLIDRNIMYGVMEFYIKCIKNNIKPIVGLEIEHTNQRLFALNFDGYRELMRISSFLNSKNNNVDDLVIDYNNIFEFKNDVKFAAYVNKNDNVALEDFYKISGKENIQNVTNLMTREEFQDEYGIEILNQIDELANSVNLIIEEQKHVIPNFFKPEEGINENEYLKNLLKEKLVDYLNYNKELNKQVYIDRLAYEFSVIEKMNFESYFLIVSDIVKWAKENDIMVGPGRGSAPGSLISFLLSITTIDPIANDLLFERFLNPDRVTMPDIDIDFEDSRRDEVIDYITNKYGYERVAQIITFQTLRARMSFKDVARIKGLSATRANEITKLIPEEFSLEVSYKTSKKFREAVEADTLIKEIFESAKLLEGLPRQQSTHAAGVVISQTKLIDSVPTQDGYSTTLLTQYSMNYMEYNGLLKIDVLGLRNLSFIKETVKSIKDRTGEVINLNELNLNDPSIYQMFSAGKTSGIFQLESPGMRNSLKEIKPTIFEDVVATTSLFRPGPVKNIPEFANRKNGLSKFEFEDEVFKKILGSTYGIIVYQEQIMELVQKVANFPLSKADILRRAIGKKDHDLLESLRSDFFEGAIANGYTKEKAKEIYDLIEEFSDYGFNRSHAFAYTIISFQLAYLKNKYPLDFMCSLVNSSMGNTDKTFAYINEITEMGFKINKPSIFESDDGFKILNNEIYIGFRTIKKIGESIIGKIKLIQNHKDNIKDIVDLIVECEKNGITRGSVEILIKSGSFDMFGLSVDSMLESLDRVYKYIDMIKVKDGEGYIFDSSIIEKPLITETSSKDKNESYFLEVVGFNLPNEESKNEIKTIETNLNIDNSQIMEPTQDMEVNVVGKIVSKRIVTTKFGKDMAFVDIETSTKKVNLTIWPGVFEKISNLITNDNLIHVKGKFDLKRGETIVVSEIEEI